MRSKNNFIFLSTRQHISKTLDRVRDFLCSLCKIHNREGETCHNTASTIRRDETWKTRGENDNTGFYRKLTKIGIFPIVTEGASKKRCCYLFMKLRKRENDASMAL